MKKTLLLLFLFVPVLLCGRTALASGNGSSTDMLAFYDDKLFVINFVQLPPGGEQANLTNNKSINIIYMSDAGLPGGGMFIPVLNAIQGDGFNPLWQEVQITFKVFSKAHQFTSDNDILAAAATGEITLTQTTEVYRCSVVGTALP